MSADQVFVHSDSLFQPSFSTPFCNDNVQCWSFTKISMTITGLYLPYCAPLPRLSQSLQGDCTLSLLDSELQVEEVEDWRINVELVLLGLRKNIMPLEVVFFWSCSVCCCDLSCWLRMIWMSSWSKTKTRKKYWEYYTPLSTLMKALILCFCLIIILQ